MAEPAYFRFAYPCWLPYMRTQETEVEHPKPENRRAGLLECNAAHIATIATVLLDAVLCQQICDLIMQDFHEGNPAKHATLAAGTKKRLVRGEGGTWQHS